MGKDVKPVVNITKLPMEKWEYGQRFHAEFGEIGQALGLNGLGAMLHVVAPGKTACPYHRHHVSDEMFLIISGSGTYRLGDKTIEIGEGDCLGAPAGGEAHQIINTGTKELRYIGFSNNGNSEIVEYPDSGKIGVRAGATGNHFVDATFNERGRLSAADYWDGEDTGETK